MTNQMGYNPFSQTVADTAYFFVGNDPLPPITSVAGHTQLQDISPTHYKLAKYIQFWINTCLSPKWEEYKTLAGLTDSDMRKICTDDSWSYIPFDISAITNVDYLPRWVLYSMGGNFENMSTELYWKITNYYLMFVMKPFVDPKFYPFQYIMNLIPNVVGSALTTNQIDNTGSMYFDPNLFIIEFGKYEIGALPITMNVGKQAFYQAVGMEITLKEQMMKGDLLLEGTAMASYANLIMTTPNDNTTPAAFTVGQNVITL